MEESAEVQEKQYSDVEQVAIKLGWNPDYSGEGAKDAETFILSSREIQDGMKNSNKRLKREIADLRVGIDDLRNHYAAQNQATINRLKREVEKLNREKKTAIADGDSDRVTAIDEEIETIRQSVPNPKQHVPAPSEAFLEWNEANQWYGSDAEMTAFAEAFTEDPLIKAMVSRGVSEERVLKRIKEQVKAEFPERFQDKETKAPPKETGKKSVPAVETGALRGGQRSKATFSEKDLSPEQLSTGRRFVRLGAMTMDEYVKSLHEIGEI